MSYFVTPCSQESFSARHLCALRMGKSWKGGSAIGFFRYMILAFDPVPLNPATLQSIKYGVRSTARQKTRPNSAVIDADPQLVLQTESNMGDR